MNKSEVLKAEHAWLMGAAKAARVNKPNEFSPEFLRGFEAAAGWLRHHALIATEIEYIDIAVDSIEIEVEVETRVRYIFNADYRDGDRLIHTYEDTEWYGPGPDGAAAYPWIMNNAIAWVETRTVNRTEWEVSDGREV